jgi:DNA-binding NtrC family response regulator
LKSIENGALRRLLSYSWPGNVRDLSNVIKSAVVKAEIQQRERIQVEDLVFPNIRIPGTVSDTTPATISEPTLLLDDRRERLQRVLNPMNKKELTCDDSEQIKEAIRQCRGKLESARRLLLEAGYEKGASRGRLRNMVGELETKSAECPKLADWYEQKYRMGKRG